MQTIRYVQRARPSTSNDLCTTFCALYISARGLSTTRIHLATVGTNNATPNPQHSANPESHKRGNVSSRNKLGQPPNTLELSPQEKLAEARQQTKEALSKERAKAQVAPRQGGLASNSIFADGFMPTTSQVTKVNVEVAGVDTSLSERSPRQMAARLDPRPRARRKWERKMVIREIRRSGRPTREMLLARTERTHTSKSRFFKTSIKKLAPLARQIAGKSIDEAILQMRFSNKQVAAEVQKHLIQARNEAIVIRGMGASAVGAELPSPPEGEKSMEAIRASIVNAIRSQEPSTVPSSSTSTRSEATTGLTQSSAVIDRQGPEITTPAETVPLPTQNASKLVRKNMQPNQTDMYIAQAWVNRGQYGAAANHRARGRIDRLRLPYTGISVILKEESTRTREKAEKEMKAIKKRLNGKAWTQLPDRPIVRQSQYVLW